jgi:hypothetical protein
MKADPLSPVIIAYNLKSAQLGSTEIDHPSQADARPPLFNKLQVNML